MDGGMKKVLEKDATAAKHAADASGTPLSPDSSQPRSVTFLSNQVLVISIQGIGSGGGTWCLKTCRALSKS